MLIKFIERITVQIRHAVQIAGFNVPTGLVKGTANTLKVGGLVLGGVGVLMTGAEIYSGKKSLFGEGGVDLIMGGVAFVPGGGVDCIRFVFWR